MYVSVCAFRAAVFLQKAWVTHHMNETTYLKGSYMARILSQLDKQNAVIW